MKAMILAAGRGERMRPLTDVTPKPLLRVGGKALVVRLIESLARAGFTELVMNVSHLGEQIVNALGNGGRWNVSIQYSREVEALETAGGIAQALPLLGSERFMVVNGDLYTDYDFSRLTAPTDSLAHLVLVPNPAHHPGGDFAVDEDGILVEGQPKRTFSGIGLYQPELFASVERGTKYSLALLLKTAIAARRASGEHFMGSWIDVGTPERLAALDSALRL